MAARSRSESSTPAIAAAIGAQRFVREIRTSAGLQHPHILGLIDPGEASGTAYYVMPLVEGQSLRDRLRQEKQLSITDCRTARRWLQISASRSA